MIKSYFSSFSERPLIEIVHSFFDNVEGLAKNHDVEIHIMLFSFTHPYLSHRLKEIAKSNPAIQIKILADWGLVSDDAKRKVKSLALLNLENLEIRFTYDQPYLWNEEKQQLQWNYQTSLGLLHHRTATIFLDHQPVKLLTGSFNWTKQAGENYENLLEFKSSTKNISQVIWDIENEFQSIWRDPHLSLSFSSSILQKQYTQNQYIVTPDTLPTDIRRLTGQKGGDLSLPTQSSQDAIIEKNEFVAFSSKSTNSTDKRRGFSEKVNSRYFMMKSNSGKEKRVPIDITTTSLDLIFRANKDSVLRVAMFALSSRVAEYGALLEAARRGVVVKVILGVEIETIEKIRAVAQKEGIPIEVMYGAKCMHQKYMVDVENGNIITGTANMTTDAIERHMEHRFRFASNHSLAQEFAKDFDRIWQEECLKV